MHGHPKPDRRAHARTGRIAMWWPDGGFADARQDERIKAVRHRRPPHVEDLNREQLCELAKQRSIKGRSKMGEWDLIEALRRTS